MTLVFSSLVSVNVTVLSLIFFLSALVGIISAYPTLFFTTSTCFSKLLLSEFKNKKNKHQEIELLATRKLRSIV